jgi:hypothetical protein
MEQSKAIRLSKLVETINGQIAQLQVDGLADTALLLEMARLDLQTRLHDISAQELKDLCQAIENGDMRSHTRTPIGGVTVSIGRNGRRNSRQSVRIASSNGRVLSKDNQHA